MSVEPPSSGRPTGPPSGPLSGPSEPPSGPPSEPPPGPPSQPSGGDAPEPGRPWWRSVPRVAVLTTAVVAAVVLAVVFTRPGGGSGTGGEVFLQGAAKPGPDPFTESTASDSSAPPVSASPTAESAPANAVRGVNGGAAGLYGGSQKVSSCDVEKQIKYLQAAPAKNRAFASVAGVDTAQVPSYLRSLTPVQLRMDTRVTNHGYRDGTATGYQAVLQSGTAVLVDGRGVPRVRCACGNPLTPPVAQQGTPKQTGDSWPSYRSSNVVVVSPSVTVVNVFVLYDSDHRHWFERHRGDTGGKDHKTDRPVKPTPSVSVTTPSPSTLTSHSPSPCASSPNGKPSTTPCPPTSTAPSSPSSPSSSSPPPAPPTSVPPSSAPPSSVPGTSEAPAPQPPLSGDTTANSPAT